MNNKFYSQCGQDELLYNLFFRDKRDGFFVEIGAADGVEISNTYFFEKELGWKGVCIEPRESSYNLLKKNRKCLCENVCISDRSGEQIFHEYPGSSGVFSGLKDKYDTEHLKTIKRLFPIEQKEMVEKRVRVMTFKELLKKYDIKHIDYASIDTEGGELDIIRSLEGSEIGIDCISIENNYGDRSIRRYLGKIGYFFLTKTDFDEIYISHDFLRQNLKIALYERMRHEYYRAIPYKARIIINKLLISKPIKILFGK